MGQRGPLPQPTALRLLNGNPSGKAINESEPLPKRMVTLEPPAELGAVARRIWANNAAELERLGLLTMIDAEAFYRYCWTAEQWHKAKTDLDTRGALLTKLSDDGATVVSVYQNPSWYIERSYAERLQQYESAFGMNPSARSRIRIDAGVGSGGVTPDHDPFE